MTVQKSGVRFLADGKSAFNQHLPEKIIILFILKLNLNFIIEKNGLDFFIFMGIMDVSTQRW